MSAPNSSIHPAAGSFGQERAWPGVMYNACNDADTEFMELKEGLKSTPYETPACSYLRGNGTHSFVQQDEKIL